MKSFIDQMVNFAKVENTKPLFEHSWFGTLLGNDKRRAQLQSYGSVSTLFAIVSRNAESCAGVDWGLYRPSKTRKKEDRKLVDNHSVMDLWEQPNPFMTGFDFREAIFQHIDLTGEAYIMVTRSQIAKGLPLEMWPIRPDRMEPVSHVNKFLLGWIYNGPNGERIPLELDEVIPIYWTDPMHPGQRGLGPVQALLTDIDSAKFSAEWNKNFFVNGARPGGIIEVEKRLSGNEWKEMVSRWRDQHQGVANAHRVAVIEQGKWIETKYSMRDMQFAELREISREVIREAFGYPKIMLGTVEDVNRANAEVGEEMYGRWLLTPRLRRVRNAINGKLIPMFRNPSVIEIDFDDPVPESREANDRERDSKSLAALRLSQAGYDGKDILKTIDLPDMDWNEDRVTSGGFGNDNDQGNGNGNDRRDNEKRSPSTAGTGVVFHPKRD